MNNNIHYISLGVSVLLLLGIGLTLDRVGGLAIRTDDVSSSIDLVFSEPALRGVPLVVRWQADGEKNIGIGVRLISSDETFVLGTGELLAGTVAVTIPCELPPAPFRLELFSTVSGALMGVSEIDVLPAGPDCVG